MTLEVSTLFTDIPVTVQQAFAVNGVEVFKVLSV